MRIYITSIPVADYNKALTFYTEVLGFKKKKDIELDEGVRFITLVSPEDPDGPELLLEPNANYHGMKASREALAEDGIPTSRLRSMMSKKSMSVCRSWGLQKPSSEGGWVTAVFDGTNGNLIEIAEVKENDPNVGSHS